MIEYEDLNEPIRMIQEEKPEVENRTLEESTSLVCKFIYIQRLQDLD